MSDDIPETVDHNEPLSIRPFADISAGHYFSGDDDRQQKLDLLTHLIPYGGIILINGESGIGKTTLLQYLETRVNEFCRVCRLDAEDCIDPRQLILQMLECFAWQPDVRYNADGSQLRALREHLEILHRNGYAPVLMIDDAESLPDSVFDILEQLFGEDGQRLLTLVLAGNADMKKRMASPVLQPLAVHLVHELELSPFSAAEQTAYVRARLAWVGIDDMGPFQTATLKFIYAASRGVPRRVNELAQVFWDNRKSDGDTDAVSSGRNWRGQLRYVVPIVLVSLGVALFTGPLRKALFSTPEPVATSAVDVSTQHDDSLTTAVNETVVTVDDKSVNETSPTSVSNPQVEVPSSESLTAINIDASTQESTSASPEGTVTTMAQVDDGQMETPASDQGETVVPSRSIEDQTRTISDAVVERTRAELAASAPRQTEPGGGERDQGQWWLSQPGDQYAIQLLAMKDAEVDRYLREHELASSVTTYRVRRGDKELLAVAVGPFATRDDAGAQARQWQQRLPGISPWVRSVASIQQTVRANQAESTGAWLARVRANEQQLLKAPADAYAVQLMAVNRQAVTDFVDKHGLTDKVVYFRTRVDGQERYVALMEDFTDREQAMAAGNRIATELKGIRPWVRSLASVQKVIRDYEDHPR